MDHMEMVEKLRAKANVSYEEARRALEENDWDMLDALVMLENAGKVKGAEENKAYTTQENEKTIYFKADTKSAKEGLGRLWSWVKDMVRKGNRNQFVISRKGEDIISMPITVMVLLILIPRVGLPTILIAMFVGLLLGARYSFRGPDIGAKVNNAIQNVQEKAAKAVEIRKNEKDVHVDIDLGGEKKDSEE